MIDVTVIGGGITGSSTAFNLRRLGMTNVRVISNHVTPRQLGSSQVSLPALGGMADNITRIDTSRGSAIARDVWHWGQVGLRHLVQHCSDKKVPVTVGDHVRAATAPMEPREMAVARTTFEGMGLHVGEGRLQDLVPASSVAAPTQIEPGQSAAVNLEGVLRSLTHDLIPGLADRIEDLHTHMRVWLNGQPIDSEFVVLATHTQSAILWPLIREWLVPYGDEMHLLHGSQPVTSFSVGSTLTWNFGYNHLSRVGESQYVLGGARFLRPDGGIGQSAPSLHAPCLPALLKDAQAFFPDLFHGTPVASLPYVEIRPCDELPLVGPLPGHERILLATGFMGHGIAQGFHAGKCLADIILKGKSQDLPEILLPRRLRTMDG